MGCGFPTYTGICYDDDGDGGDGVTAPKPFATVPQIYTRIAYCHTIDPLFTRLLAFVVGSSLLASFNF